MDEKGDKHESGKTASRRGRIPSINKALIEAAVRKVGDQEEVTMHGVAKSLGVNVTTLYRHTGGLEYLKIIHARQKSTQVGEVPAAAGLTWKQWLGQLADFYRTAFLSNPDLLKYAQAALDPDLQRLERATQVLIDYGFSALEAVRTHAFLINNVVGYVSQELQTQLESDEGQTPTYARLAEILKSRSHRLPALSELRLGDEELDNDANFRYFIDCAIQGVAARQERKEMSDTS